MLSHRLASGTILTAFLSLFTMQDSMAAPVEATRPAPPASTTSAGHITLNGQPLAYHAIAGTLLVHGRHYDDSRHLLLNRGELPSPSHGQTDHDQTEGKKDDQADRPSPVASMFYTAYFRDVHDSTKRPLVFFYNGGPGSSSVWLHMGSFAPVRVNTPGDSHLPAPPNALIANPQSLLDIADLVFIDAPGTGFSRIDGPEAKKEFYGVDGDAAAFTHFITAFLTHYQRFNSPRYLFGESYGTLRSALIANRLAQDEGLDLNGVILLSQILSYDDDPDGVALRPGADLPYVLALPSYAAAAWYHHTLPQPQPELKAFLNEVEHFSSTDYLLALQQGNDLPQAQRQKIAETLHRYTGISTSYILRANLRLSGGMFEHELLQDHGLTTGRLDTRYSSPSIDPLSKEPVYDPQASALSSVYLSTFNNYVRHTLHYGTDTPYLSMNGEANNSWDSRHEGAANITPNVLPDLAMALKTNPRLKIMLNSGYYDLATPYYQGIYEMKHLPIPPSLEKNISIFQYPVGHMVYVDPTALQALHDNIAHFIQSTDTP